MLKIYAYDAQNLTMAVLGALGLKNAQPDLTIRVHPVNLWWEGNDPVTFSSNPRYIDECVIEASSCTVANKNYTIYNIDNDNKHSELTPDLATPEPKFIVILEKPK